MIIVLCKCMDNPLRQPARAVLHAVLHAVHQFSKNANCIINLTQEYLNGIFGIM